LQIHQKEEIARVERRVQQIAREMSDRAAKELESVQEESLKKNYQRKLDEVTAHATSKIRQEKEKVSDRRPPASSVKPTERLPVEVGSRVLVESLGVTGSVLSVHSGEAEVLVGNIRLRRPIADLEVTEKPSLKLPPGVRVSISSADPVSSEINLLGCTVDDATSRTDKFLDEAFLAQLPVVRIVHGSGTGALRNAIADLLKNHPHVVRFEFAPQNQGGRGVTVATLRD
jgi:DNA mismatch repair protein MutS2